MTESDPTGRRAFLRSSGLALAGLGLSPALLRAATDQLPVKSSGKVLVLVFQRGACDGLAMVPPLGDGHYSAYRPTLALEPSGDGAALRLDDTFGLHPSLSAFKPFFDAGQLAVIHETGSMDPTRSHFDAQDFLESGTPGLKSTGDGCFNRALQSLKKGSNAPFRAVALQPNLPRILQGESSALALNDLADFQLRADMAGNGGSHPSGFEGMYQGALDRALRGVGDEAFSALKELKTKDPRGLLPSNGANYPNSSLGRRMKQIAQLIKADLGVQMAVTDCGGWDTHVGQGNAKGQLANRLQDFGDSLGAFLLDLRERMDQVCLVTVTEFGRTVRENGNRGTDHGHGSVMFVAGGKVRGKRVIATWKSLASQDLYEDRDLPVTTDHRDALGEILDRHLGVPDLGKVFPGFPNDRAKRPGIFRA